MDASDMSTTLALLGDDDDLAFFDGLFDDLPDHEPPSPLLVTVSLRSERRRQRWVAIEDTTTLSRALGPSPWRLVAQQQKHELTVAEQENAKLRKLIEVHARTAKKMTKLIQKAASMATKDILPNPTSLWMSFIGPAVDLGQLTNELDTLAQRADDILASSALAATTTNGFAVDQHVQPTPYGDAFEATVEVTLLLPFDVESITNVVANNGLKLVTRKGPANVQTVCDTDIKIIQAVSRPKEKNGYQITKHGQLTTRREPPRSDGSNLVVMATSGGLVLDGTMVVAMKGSGYVLVSAVPGHDSASLGPLSSVRWYRHFSAQPSAAANMSQGEYAKWIRDFSTRWKQKAAREVDKGAQTMENLLLTSSSRKH